MIKKLTIENIALVKKATLEFDSGLTVLTGETGGGKSVVVTALSLALGERADQDYIRHGTTRACVTAEFDDLYIERELSRTGAGRLKLNDNRATLLQLKEISPPPAQILGQHAGQELLDEARHLDFVDRFASLMDLRQEVEQAFYSWQKAADELKRVINRREQLVQERELLLFQQEEIQKASIRVGEEEELLQERRILDSAQQLMAASAGLTDVLGGENGVIDLLGAARKQLEQMADIDPSLAGKVGELMEIDYQLEDMRRFVEGYGSSVQDNPARLEEVNIRLDEIYKLKKKYGGSEEFVLATLGDIENKLEDRPDIDTHINELQAQERRLRQVYTEIALRLSTGRRAAAKQLGRRVIEELRDLAIDRAQFDCELVYENDDAGIAIEDRTIRPLPCGLEQARFLFSANPGEPLKSLVKTASGGEVSRVLLALKSAELSNQPALNSGDNRRERRTASKRTSEPLPLLVFDEVDVGIGGRTAVEVGRKLKRLSERCQVIVITHLHQIARVADHHFVAEKESEGGSRTVINVRRLRRDEIAVELERMVALPKA